MLCDRREIEGLYAVFDIDGRCVVGSSRAHVHSEKYQPPILKSISLI
jgi:hypothetical protein